MAAIVSPDKEDVVETPDDVIKWNKTLIFFSSNSLITKYTETYFPELRNNIIFSRNASVRTNQILQNGAVGLDADMNELGKYFNFVQIELKIKIAY